MVEIERPDLSHMNTQEVAQMLIICGESDDESDRAFPIVGEAIWFGWREAIADKRSNVKLRGSEAVPLE